MHATLFPRREEKQQTMDYQGVNQSSGAGRGSLWVYALSSSQCEDHPEHWVSTYKALSGKHAFPSKFTGWLGNKLCRWMQIKSSSLRGLWTKRQLFVPQGGNIIERTPRAGHIQSHEQVLKKATSSSSNYVANLIILSISTITMPDQCTKRWD